MVYVPKLSVHLVLKVQGGQGPCQSANIACEPVLAQTPPLTSSRGFTDPSCENSAFKTNYASDHMHIFFM